MLGFLDDAWFRFIENMGVVGPDPHYTTVMAESGKSLFSAGFFLGKGVSLLCSKRSPLSSVR
jgi:hypothetical protein